MILQPFLVIIQDDEEAKNLHRELLLVFENKRISELPTLARYLQNLNFLYANNNNNSTRIADKSR